MRILKGEKNALVIPAINSPDVKSIGEKFLALQAMGVLRAHVDIADGAFAPVHLLDSPETIQTLAPYAKRFFIETHLMVMDPLKYVDALVAAGVRRIIFHVETMPLHRFTEAFFSIKKKYPRLQIGVAMLPGTDADTAVPYGGICGFIECLTVQPGFSGQEAIAGVGEKIEYIRRGLSSCVIEVDGGVNDANAGALKKAGADILVSGAYIFSSPDPRVAYEKLMVV